jgi:hypothetical protein
MTGVQNETRDWKLEQLKYFKGYLNNFKNDSPEYKLLLSGIKELEKNL